MFTLLYHCINTVVVAELSLHHNINIDRQDHCTVRQTNAKSHISGSTTTSLLSHAKVEMTNFLLVHFRRTSKKFALRLLHVCKLFAGSSKMNQQKVCTSTFYTCANFLLVRRKWTSKKFVLRLLHVCKLFAGSITTSLRFHTKVELTNFLLVHFRRTSKKFALRLLHGKANF